MKTLSIFSLLIISMTLTNATTAKIKDASKETKRSIINVPVRFIQPLRFVVVRNSLISHLGLPVSNAFFRNESTGETVFGAGTLHFILKCKCVGYD